MNYFDFLIYPNGLPRNQKSTLKKYALKNTILKELKYFLVLFLKCS